MQLKSSLSSSKHSEREWLQLSQKLGLEPGRQVGRGKVSITCPACGRRPERGNASQTVLFLDSGGFCCQRGDCKGTGHLLKWARDNGRLGHGASHEASPIFALSGGHELDGHHLISRLVDLPSAYQGFENLKPSQRSYIERWARKRGCPSAVAWALARLPDVHHCPQTIPGQRQEARHARAIAQRAQRRPLLFWMRDEEGRLVSLKHRGQDTSPKSLELPNAMTGARGFRAFGFEPRAIEQAVAMGQPIVLVEGEVDWAFTQAALNIKGGGVALGAWNNRDMEKLAKHLAEVLPRGSHPWVYIFPDEDGKPDGATRRAAAAAASVLLRAGAKVHTVTIPEPWRDDEGRGDAADVLCHQGLEAFIKLILDSPCVSTRARGLDAQRHQLRQLAHEFFTRGGQHVVNSDLGAGKTFIIAIEGAIEALKRNPEQRIVVSLGTRHLVREKFLEARQLAGGLVPVSMLLGRGEDNCELIRTGGQETLQAAATLVPDGAAHLCQACPFRSQCLSQGYLKQRRVHAHRHGLVFTTAATLAMHPELVDGAVMWSPNKSVLDAAQAVIHDEFPESLKADLSINGHQLQALMSNSGLLASRHVYLALMGLLLEGQATPEQLWELAPPGSLRFEPLSIDFAARRALLNTLMSAPAEAAQVLSRQAPWFAAEALERACNHNWRGCYVADGKLLLPATPPGIPLAQGTMLTAVLDATMPQAAAEAVMPGATFHDLGGPAPETCRVLYCDFEISKASLEQPTAHAMAMAVRRRFDGPSTLHGTHKAHAQELGDLVRGQVIHHGGTLARGSNAYQDCDTAVIDAYHVPKATRRAFAQRLQMRAEAGGGCGMTDFEPVARFLLEQAPTLQLAGRLRYNDGKPATIVIMSPTLLAGLPCDGWLRRSEVMIEAGLVPKGREAIGPLLRELLEETGGVICPEFWPRKADEHETGTRLVGLPRVYSPDPTDKSGSDAVIEGLNRPKQGVLGNERQRAIVSAVKEYYGRNWERAASDAGVLCTHVQTSRSGRAVAVLHKQALSHDALRRVLYGEVDWFEGASGRVNLVASELELAVERLKARGAELSTQALADEEGIGARAVRKRIQADGWPSTVAFLEYHRLHQALWLEEFQATEELTATEELEESRGKEGPPEEPPPAASTSMLRGSRRRVAGLEAWSRVARWQQRAQAGGEVEGPSGRELARLAVVLRALERLWEASSARTQAWSWQELEEFFGRPVQKLEHLASIGPPMRSARVGTQDVRQRWRGPGLPWPKPPGSLAGGSGPEGMEPAFEESMSASKIEALSRAREPQS